LIDVAFAHAKESPDHRLPQLTDLPADLRVFNPALGYPGPERVDISRPLSLIRPGPDRQQSAELIEVSRLPRRIRQSHQLLPLGAVMLVMRQVGMHDSGKRPVNLPDDDVIVPIRTDHLGSNAPSFGSLATPLGPERSLFGASGLFLLVQLLVRERTPEERETLEPLLETLDLHSQSLDLTPPRTKALFNAPV
jgi:hypothetical protein